VVAAVVVWAVLGGVGRSAPPPGKPLVDAGAALSVLGGGNSPAAVAGSLRSFLVAALPDPLYDDARHWGLQKPGPRGKRRNEGRWWKARVNAVNPADTLVVDLRDLRRAEPGRTTFTLFLSFDARVQLDRQTWRSGLRLYSGSTRARLRAKLTLRCEAVMKVVPGASLLPDAVFRLRVLESDFRYDNLVVEHTAGVGGEAAKVLGDALHRGLSRWKPSLERDLLARANAAVAKAADTKEVRLSLSNLLGGKGK
jgi:hypothetical protein